jgi:uncharacterized membrane protein
MERGEVMSRNDTGAVEPDEELAVRVEVAISTLLRAGVIASLVLLVTGLVVIFVHHPSYLQSADALRQLTRPGAAFPHTVGQVITGLLAWRGQALAALGIMVLIATPILRVAISIIAFVVQRDRAFVVITAVVLIVLLSSFFLGRVE